MISFLTHLLLLLALGAAATLAVLWQRARRATLLAQAGTADLTLATTRAQEEARHVQAQRDELINFINRFVEGIASSTAPQQWLDSVANELARAVGAQLLWVYFTRDDKVLRLAARVGQLPPPRPNEAPRFRKSARLLEQLGRPQLEVGDCVVGEVALSGESVSIEQYEAPASGPSAVGELRVNALLVVPVSLNGQVIGVICAVNKQDPSGHFTVDDRFLLESLSGHVALGTTLTQLWDALSEQQRIRQELEMAQRIQLTLLPRSFPSSPEFSIFAEYQPALEVGGDYYDFIQVDADHLLVVVADASGKGIPACMMMAMCRSFLRYNAMRFRENLEGLFIELNDNLNRDSDGSQFVTMGCCLLDQRDHTVEYARAGHTELLLRLPDGRVQIISPDGPALGLVPASEGVSFDTLAFSWMPGTSMMLFTDGLTEAEDKQGQQFGLDRLIAAWKQQSQDPKAAARGVRLAVERFAVGTPQRDDQTIVIMTRPTDEPPPAAAPVPA